MVSVVRIFSFNKVLGTLNLNKDYHYFEVKKNSKFNIFFSETILNQILKTF